MPVTQYQLAVLAQMPTMHKLANNSHFLITFHCVYMSVCVCGGSNVCAHTRVQIKTEREKNHRKEAGENSNEP